MTVEICFVMADIVRPLRHSVLRQGAPIAESVYPVDDHPLTKHLAALDEGAVVGTATFFPEPHEGRAAWRLRGMAVAGARRGQGIGASLLKEVIDDVGSSGDDLIWCNARTVALPFYRRQGFRTVGDEFLAASGIPHYVALLKIQPGQA